MLYAIHCLDHAGKAALREANRQRHADYMARHASRIRYGGPLLNEGGTERIGILVVIELDGSQALQTFLKHEPYHQAGLFERVVATPYVPVMPQPSDTTPV